MLGAKMGPTLHSHWNVIAGLSRILKGRISHGYAGETLHRFLPKPALPFVMADGEIALKTVINHMQALAEQSRTQIKEMCDRFSKRFDQVEFQLERLEVEQQRMERNLTRQIDAIDKRLDEIEIAKLPQRMARVEEHLR
jgi:hypothetical protein